MGTLDYMSPEQIEGKPADGRADEYALACSAFELLTGAPPFRRDEPTAVMYAQLSEPPPQLTSRRPDLPRAVDGVLAKALAKAPADRYASCREFANALREAFGFQPYDSGPGIALAATHPPTETAWPAARGAVQRGGPGADTAGTLSRVPAVGSLPTGETNVPAAFAATTDPGQIPARGDGGDRAQPPRRRRRIAVIALAAAVILSVAGLAAGLLQAGTPSHGSATLQIAAKSALPPVTGDVYVVYRGSEQADAQIYGQIKKAASGEVAQLYAQQFPYKQSPAEAGSVILRPTGTTARYQFQVTPTLATRYQVELFQSSTASAPVASSAITTIYVTLGGTSGNGQSCSRPVCHESLPTTNFVPPSALSTEMSKQWYPYFGLNLAPTKQPAPPEWLSLGAGSPHITAPHRVSADEFGATVTFSFQIGNDAYHWDWSTCSKDTEAKDGIGLPGHHGCGDERVLDSAAYLG